MTTVRTRFAPSPTGFLHVGSVRTALFCWLYARKMKGQCVLRIEDTDLARSTKACIDAILQGMSWLGLDYDEGPIYQTDRFARYQEVIEQLLDEKKAYRCYCSKERLETMRKEQMENKQKPRYDGHCRKLKKPQKGNYVVRFRNPDRGSVKFEDTVHGLLKFKNSELDDLIIARSDGSPTYNFTVVVDDWDMNITHVIRGDDHINNTPRQINILKALEVEPPTYVHVPMILGTDGKKLSKRHGAVDVMQYREDGFLPQALLNYLVRLGWSHKDKEIFSIQEMVELFDLESLHRSPAAFDFDKLLWLNQHHMRTADPARIAQELSRHLKKLGVEDPTTPALEDVVRAQVERCKTLKEMAERSLYFYVDFEGYDEIAARKNFKPSAVEVLQYVLAEFERLTEWKAPALHQIILDAADILELKLGKIAQPVRVAIAGGAVSPPLDVTLELIGRERVLERMQRAILYSESRAQMG